jgi:predicted RNA-binding Zn-ribbon protein involved in translation (DUF1610 family)
MPKYRQPTKKDWVQAAAYISIAVVLITISAVGLTKWEWPVGMIVGLTLCVGGTLYVLGRWHARATAYRCPECGCEFEISAWKDFVSPHVPDKKYLKCPKCGQRKWTRILMKA